ncbi:MAG: peptidoglycan DD-metalloendopeptidase family protein [Bacilli bacterium]
MNKKRKLKGFVMPTIYTMLVATLVISTFMTFSNSNDEEVEEDITYVSSVIWSNDTPVVATDKVVVKPFTNKDVTIGKYYYDYKDSSDEQQNAIIFYENSYIQNSGVDYILEDSFDVVSIYDGTVIKVEDNDIVGKTVEIKHDNNIISVYQSLSEVNVKQGDIITLGTKIGKSGNSKINKDLGNHLHVEIYVNGQVVNPEDCYNKKLTDLQ